MYSGGGCTAAVGGVQRDCTPYRNSSGAPIASAIAMPTMAPTAASAWRSLVTARATCASTSAVGKFANGL